MLKGARIVPHIPATNVAGAREFYEEKLGLMPKEEYAGGVIYECRGGSWAFMYPSAGWLKVCSVAACNRELKFYGRRPQWAPAIVREEQVAIEARGRLVQRRDHLSDPCAHFL